MFELLLITNRKVSNNPLAHTVQSALEGGVDAVQLREKDLTSKGLFEMADELRRLTSKYNAKLIINDRVDVALAVDADGVHLGWRSLPITKVRSMIGPGKLIGYSTHSLREAEDVQSARVDYITISPIYKSHSKSTTPIGVRKISDIKRYVNVPIIALGGIGERNVEEVLEHGADGVAVISRIQVSRHPVEAAKRLRRKITNFKK